MSRIISLFCANFFVLILSFPFISMNHVLSQSLEYRLINRFGRGQISDLAWSPNKEILAAGGTQGVWLYNSELEDLNYLPSEGVKHLAWASQPNHLIVLTQTHNLQMWDIQSGELSKEINLNLGDPYDTYLSSNGAQLTTVERLNDTFCIEFLVIERLDNPQELDCIGERPVDLTWNIDSSQIAVVTREGNLIIWDTSRQTQLFARKFLTSDGTIEWATQSGHLAVSGRDERGHRLTILDAVTYTSQMDLETEKVYEMAWSPDNARLVYSTLNSIEILNVESGETMMLSKPSNSPVSRLTWKGNTHLSIYSHDGTLSIINIQSNQITAQSNDHSPGVQLLNWSPDDQYLAVNRDESLAVQIIDPTTGAEIIRLDAPYGQPVPDMDWSADSRTLAVSYPNNQVTVWSIIGEEKAVLSYPLGEDNGYPFVTWHPSEPLLASSQGPSFDRSVVTWDVSNMTALEIFSVENATWVEWKPSGEQIAIGKGDFSVLIWDIQQQTSVRQSFSNIRIAWHPLESKIAGSTCRRGAGDCSLWIVDLDLGQKTQEISPQAVGTPNDIAWHPMGQIIAIAWSEEIFLWDTTTGHITNIIQSQTEGHFRSIAWNSDGSQLAAGNSDGSIDIWEIDLSQ